MFHMPCYSRLELACLFGVRESTINGWVKNKDFPAPIKIGRIVRWRFSDVKPYLGELECPDLNA
jgi:predicted DNA-binding transcriptional regulator AlpA